MSRRIRMLMLLALTAAVSLLLPETVFAWGPGVHLALGNSLLTHLSSLPTCVADLLRQFPEMFLYGCLSADICVGKTTRLLKNDSHTWRMGREMLTRAADPSSRSYALGYMCHLAADTVAHNYYVPNLMSMSPLRNNLTHMYVEIRADSQVDWSHSQARNLLTDPAPLADDLLIASVNAPLSFFRLQKRMYQGSLFLWKPREWENLPMTFVDRRMTPEIENSAYLSTMVNLAFSGCLSVLNTGNGMDDKTPFFALDPSGMSNMRRVRALRARQRRILQEQGLKNPLFVPETSLLRESI